MGKQERVARDGSVNASGGGKFIGGQGRHRRTNQAEVAKEIRFRRKIKQVRGPRNGI